MRFKKILIVGLKEYNLDTAHWKQVKSLGFRVSEFPNTIEVPLKELVDTDCLLVSFNAPVNKNIIDNAPNLKYIGVLGTTYGKIDEIYAKKKSVVVCNIPGYSTEAVAEFAIASVLEHLRDLERGKQQARKRDFSETSFFHVGELKGKKFGVIGAGQIGSRVAEIALGFGCDVKYWSRNKKKELENKGVGFQTPETILKNSDFISLNLAFNKDTDGFLNAKRMKLIKLGAVLVNTASHEFIDEKALEQRLKKDNLTYITDHSDELTSKQVKILGKYKNCIMYPPIAYTTKEATEAKQNIFVKNIENFLAGRPTSVVN